MPETTACEIKHQAARLAEQRGLTDTDRIGRVADHAMRAWEASSDRDGFDLDLAVERSARLVGTTDYRPAGLLRAGDVLATGGTLTSAPHRHPSGWWVAEIDYSHLASWPVGTTVAIRLPREEVGR